MSEFSKVTQFKIAFQGDKYSPCNRLNLNIEHTELFRMNYDPALQHKDCKDVDTIS
jgi:hypothetical protein